MKNETPEKNWTPEEREELLKRGGRITEESRHLQIIAEYATLQEKLRLRRDLPEKERQELEQRSKELRRRLGSQSNIE